MVDWFVIVGFACLCLAVVVLTIVGLVTVVEAYL